MSYIIGTILILIGLSIRVWSISSMNGKFSMRIKIPDKLCTKGAYKYVRHPSYVGSLLVLSGVSIINPVAGICYLAFAFFLARTVQEEMILSQFKEYQEYQKKTGMFIPKVRHGSNNTKTR